MATLQGHKTKLLSIEKSKASAVSSILNTDPDFPFASELAFTFKRGCLEQKSRLPDDSMTNKAAICDVCSQNFAGFWSPKLLVDMISRGYNLNGFFLSI